MSLKVFKSNSHKEKKDNFKRPLENRIFFLDLKMYPGEVTLSKNLKLLGAKVEPLFSRSVSAVVTNRESAKSAKTFKVPSKPQSWMPLTPITNSTCHSPLFLNESSMEYMDSPPYANSPTTDQNSVPMCRGMAMVKKAILKKQVSGTTDLLEKCKEWNVKVYHVEDILPKVEKLKQQYGAHFAAEKKRTQNEERKLKPPFFKVEDPKKGGTWYREFPSSTFDTKLADKVKELYNHFKKSGSIQVAIKPPQGEFSKGKSIRSTPVPMSPATTQSLVSFSKFSEAAKPSTTFSLCNVKINVSKPIPVAAKKHKSSHAKKKKLYCEICKMNYVNLDKHLASEPHKSFMSDPMNFLDIQNIIQSLSKKEDFLSPRVQFSNSCPESDALFYPDEVLKSIDTMQVYSTGYVFFEDNFTPVLYDIQKIVPVEKNDLDTEPCSMLEQDLAPPSCSTAGSRVNPFLEDSWERIINDEAKDVGANDTPLNLSNNGNKNVNQLPTSFNQCFNYMSLEKNMAAEDLSLKNVALPNTLIDINVPESKLTSVKRKVEDILLNDLPPMKKANHMNDVALDVNVNQSLTPQHGFFVEVTQNQSTQSLQSADCSQENSLDESQFPKEEYLVVQAFATCMHLGNQPCQEKMDVSNDSGIGIHDASSQALPLFNSQVHTDTVAPKINECCALDLSPIRSKAGTPAIEQQEKNTDVCLEPYVEMPALSPNLPRKELDEEFLEISNSEDLEMPYLEVPSQRACATSFEDTNTPVMDKSEGSQDVKENCLFADIDSTPEKQHMEDLVSIVINDMVTDVSALCVSVPNKDPKRPLCSTFGFEATTTDISDFKPVAAEEDFKVELPQQTSQVMHAMASYKNPPSVDCECSPDDVAGILEDLKKSVSMRNEVDSQTSDPLAHNNISFEHKNIQQEAIYCPGSNTVDIGTFCLNISDTFNVCSTNIQATSQLTLSESRPKQVCIDESDSSSNENCNQSVMMLDTTAQSLNGTNLYCSEESCYSLIDEVETDPYDYDTDMFDSNCAKTENVDSIAMC